MSNLSNQQIKNTFDGILQVPGGITSSLKTVQDGAGNPTGLQLSSAGVNVTTSDTYVASIDGVQLVGAEPRLISDGFGDNVNVKDFGAVGDGVTDDTQAITDAASESPVFAPNGTYLTTFSNPTVLPAGKQYGSGQIKTADNNKSAPNYAVISSAPTSLGNENTILTAFNGDFSKCQFPVGHVIKGAATLGQPTTDYLYTPEAMPYYTFMYNESGWNQSTSGNGGRTGVAAYRTRVQQYGQGDAVCYNGSVFVTGTKTGSTNFLANPAGVLFNGDMQAGADGVYLNPYETFCTDDGYDVACVGIVNNFARANATGAKSTVWMGYRAQNIGSATCDALISATGKWITGLDLAQTNTDFGANKAAISLKANDRVYFNNAANASGNLNANWRTTVFNGDYIAYSSAASAIVIAAGGSPSLQISSGQVTTTKPLVLTGATGVVASGAVGFGNSTVTSASSGAYLVPTTAAGFLIINISGTYYRLAYYNA